jgi:hypothetical protein
MRSDSERRSKVIKRMWDRYFSLSILIFSTSLVAQTNQSQVSAAFAVLTKSVESKSATINEELNLRTISDVVVSGEVVIPRGSKVVGHVAETITKGKDEPQSVLAIVVDKAVTVRGVEIPLQAIIAAVAAPPNNSLSADPTYGMMHSNEPKMVGNGPGSAASSGSLSSSSKASSTAAVATAEIKGKMDERSQLDENSQGVVGYEGLSLSWHLMTPPPVSVFACKGKNVKLEAGTQILLRMTTPRLVK